jgi:predicted RNA-binding protein with PIN domain
MVVFDGSHPAGEQSGLSYKSPLVIAYSHHGQSADQYILEKLESAKIPANITVVTNDKFLSSQARSYGAHSLTVHAFLVHLEKKHSSKKKKTEVKSPLEISRRELDRLIKIFEDRLEQDLDYTQ